MLIRDNSWWCNIIQVCARKLIFIQENSNFCKNTKFCKIVPNWPILQNHGSLCKKLHEMTILFLFVIWKVANYDNRWQRPNLHEDIQGMTPSSFLQIFSDIFFSCRRMREQKMMLHLHTQKKLRTSVVRKNGLALNFVQCQKWWEK